MVLEAVMLCIDNSEFSRNGDYSTTRLQAATGTANMIVGGKTQENPENSLGVLTLGGECVRVWVTPTGELGKILSALSDIEAEGECDFGRGIQMAQLALKHRSNKSERQRIVLFVGSPVKATEDELEKLGKQLKKNNVSIDIISYGEIDSNEAKLQKLYTAANANDSSHLVTIEPGPTLLADAVRQSPIIAGGAVAGGADTDFGLAETDPELAMAIRISMEEERARQRAAQGQAPAGDAAAAPADGAPAAAPAAAPVATPAPASGGIDRSDPRLAALDPELLEGLDDMDEELRTALLLSVQDIPGNAPEPALETPAKPEATPVTPEPPAKKAKEEEATEGDSAAMFQDMDFVQDLLGGLPGVDMQDARIQEALRAVGVEKKDEEKKEEGDGK